MHRSCKEITDVIEDKYPLNLAENYDNVGLLIGDYGRTINKILVCLDITDEVLEEAIASQAQMIVSHHPLIFKPIKKLTSGNFTADIIFKIIKSDICIYALHTNFDNADEGMNDVLAELLELKRIEKLSESTGRFGILAEEMPLKDFCDYLKNKLHATSLSVSGELNRRIRNVAIVGGAGSDFISYAKAKNCDVMVTGDVKHHTALDCLCEGIALVDASHFFTEAAALPFIADFLQRHTGVEVLTTKINTNPFINI